MKETSTQSYLSYPTKRLGRSRMRRKHIISCYLMLLPPIIGFLLFSAYPILWALRFTLFDYEGVHAYFIGIDNFVRAFTRDTMFWETLGNTFILTFGKLLVELPLALVLALVLSNSLLKGKGLLRAIYFLPNIISVAIIGLIFSFMFETADGVVNNWLTMFGLIEQPINWFGNKWSAMLVLGIASLWQGFGINMLFFLSGVQSIPKELYECANLDGAGKLRSFWHITLPMLAPVIQVVFMLAMIGTMQTTDLVLVLTNGMPAGKTELVMTYIFKYIFSYGGGAVKAEYGYAASLSLITAIILGIFAVIYFKITNKKTDIY